jgi:hypothetical protein
MANEAIRRGAGPGSVCKEARASYSPALRLRTRHGFEDPLGWRRGIARGGRQALGLERNASIVLDWGYLRPEKSNSDPAKKAIRITALQFGGAEHVAICFLSRPLKLPR